MKTVTVVYVIEDGEVFRRMNPLRYEHDGLRAFRVEFGDALGLLDEIESACKEALNEKG